MAALGVAILGCGSGTTTPTGGTGAGGSGTGATGGGGAGSGAGHAGTTTETPSGTESGTMTTTTTTTPPPEVVLRFVALGDGGEGNETQYKVADAMKAICDAKGGCSFALYLGDNFYDTGVSGTEDTQFQTKFEMPYANLDFPFYVVLGNHDYGGNGAGFEFWKGQAQVDYTEVSSKWTMPSQYYTFYTPADVGPPGGPFAQFFGLDTNAIFFTGDSDQKDWLSSELAGSIATWKIGFGHHPYVSNGKHGNAGEYEGIPGIPIVSGGNVKDFFDDAVCGAMDVYLSGHDHNRQWLEPTCGTEFLVSGTAAKTTDLEGQGTPSFFEKDQLGGFLLVELTQTKLTGTFYDEIGTEEFTRTFTK